MIPTELITMGASFISSAFLTLFRNAQDNKAAIFERAMTASKAQAEIYEQVRSNPNKSFQLTRRIIALGTIGAIVWATMVVPVFWPHVPVTIGLSTMKGGFWFFSDPKQAFEWYTFNGGIVMTPLMTHMGSAITGFFFGNQITK